MNKIRFTANKDTNYIFHMLSVAKCGYDNAYGLNFRGLYPYKDLAVFKDNERLLTVRGGEHCGILYGLMVCQPACAKVSAKEYYNNLIKLGNLIKSGNHIDGVDEALIPYTDIIISISEIMVRHYDSYIENIWESEKEKIENYIPQVLDLFETSNFTEKAEELVGCKLHSDYFTATLVTSVYGGAEAIDISRENDLLDVFGIERNYLDAIYFIGHEFIIYLLLNALNDENAFKCLETWSLTEGLAEFYLKKIMGDTRFFNSEQKYAEFYENCEKTEPLSVAELYKSACKKYLV
ncbi:MAG: hypothetical protein Q4E74_09865 [Ruminococcus sp.]|nr:hypothetical protein [Ruminococcus sp.]